MRVVEVRARPGERMNGVVASRTDLERVAGQASNGAARTPDVSDTGSVVAGALPGATAGSESVAAGLFIGDLARSLTATLRHFSEIVNTSVEIYDETNQSTSLVIREDFEGQGE